MTADLVVAFAVAAWPAYVAVAVAWAWGRWGW
jgi:hypothetical protein